MKKLLFDFFPIVIFFAVYKYTGNMITATAVLIPATIFQVAYSYWRTRKVEKMYLVTLALVVVLGGATIVFENKAFIQWKPTIVNWLFALVFLGSQFIGAKSILQRMMGGQIELPSAIWTRLNLMWVGFFIFSGAANLYVAFSGQFSEEAWVNFKLFGMLGLTLVFIILQGIYLSRHIQNAPSEEPNSND